MTFFAHLYKDHAKEELIRTVDSVISLFLQVAQLVATLVGLHYIMHHPH